MDRFKAGFRASMLGIIGNIFLLIIKSFVGFATNSQSMIADAFNSATDIFSSLMTYIGNKIASKPKDDDHNLGHGKAEYIYSMLISIAMMLMSFQCLKNSIISLVYHEKVNFSIFLVIVCFVTIIVKFLLYLYTHYLYKKFNNILIEANSKDHRNDCIITTLNLIACLLVLKDIYFVDGIVGIIISIWILITAIKIFIESYDVLMDKAIDEKTKERVFEIINNHNEISKVIHFNSTPVGYKYQISFTIFVDGNLTTFDSHTIADNLEKEIDEKMPEIYLTVVHVNPI